MLSIFISILGIFITIFFVIGVHELGHFLTARLCGIKVLRFSIGFGKALFRWHDKSGTEYILAAVPLGGYVKMLDENEGVVPEKDLPFAYTRQPLYKRIAVIIAGPLTNIIFSLILYWLLFIIGFTTIKPIIGDVLPNSIAAKANLPHNQEVVQIDNQSTLTWYSAVLKILVRTGETGTLQITTQPLQSSKTETYTLNLSDWRMDKLKPDPLQSLGIIPFEPEIPAVLAIIQPDSPAARGGLKPNDKIIAIDNHPIKNWMDLMNVISTSPEKQLNFQIIRDSKTITLPITVGTQHDLLFKAHGYLGITPDFTWKAAYLRHNQYGPIAAIPYAYNQAKEFVLLNFIVFGKMITGKISLQSLGGPITIFESAGSALNQGMIPFLSFLAFLSISIGVINILPIPGLDGGHLLFQMIEFVLRRPLSDRAQNLLYRLGFIFIIVLIVQALANDVMRFVN